MPTHRVPSNAACNEAISWAAGRRLLGTRKGIHVFGMSRDPLPVLDNIRVMVIIWRLGANIIRTAVCWMCDTVFTVSSSLTGWLKNSKPLYCDRYFNG